MQSRDLDGEKRKRQGKRKRTQNIDRYVEYTAIENKKR